MHEPSKPDKGEVLKASAKDAAWYDEFYKAEQTGLSPWYRSLIPELKKQIRPDSKLIELGCGQAHVLRLLVRENVMPQENITGLDQSRTAVEVATKHLPGSRMMVGDLYNLETLGKNTYDLCLLMETIEHLEHPEKPIENIRELIKPGGLLFVSFPNYLHFPWLLVRILAEKLNHPNWIVLQPVDKIYTVFGVIKLFKRSGFELIKGVGSNYGPPLLDRIEGVRTTNFFNALRLWRFSFHPVLIFKKSVE